MKNVIPKVLGHQLDPLSLDESTDWVLKRIKQNNNPNLVVTINPEIIVRSLKDNTLKQAINDSDLTIADGVGIVWAARLRGYTLPGRVQGVALVSKVLKMGGPSLRVFFLGGKKGVAAAQAAAAARLYGTTITGTHHGYFESPRIKSDVIEEIRTSCTQLLLAGLGESQEKFLNANRSALGVNVMIGVGGTLDILAGKVIRAPMWTRRLGIEWAWRIGLNPQRWYRIPRLIRFAVRVIREPRK